MITWTLTVPSVVLGGIGWVLWIRQLVTRDDRADCWIWGVWAVSSALFAIRMIIEREPWYGLYATISAAIGAWLWWSSWRKRKNRKRRLAALGEKSRARVSALAGALKDASRGARPVLRPVPGAAK